jgi:hypothetical protein
VYIVGLAVSMLAPVAVLALTVAAALKVRSFRARRAARQYASMGRA